MVDGVDEEVHRVALRGLSAPGVEGAREPGLQDILETLGYAVDVGWSGNHLHTKQVLLGDELATQRFRKAGAADVILKPVARYSPNFLLPFGYYTVNERGVSLQTVGTLALRTQTKYEHNCLLPSLVSGEMQFDPGDEPFGIFTSSPSHTAYSEDAVNEKYSPKSVVRACRVYPLKDANGKRVENSFLICFEEARNGDYQDYVFLLQNVLLAE